MGYKNLLNKIDELRSLVGGWDDQASSQIEMDLALDRVKKIYELLRFPSDEVEDEVAEEVKFEEVVEVAATPEPEPMPEPETAPEPEPTPEPKVEPQQEEEQDEDEIILDIDILKSADSERYNKILSLYCDIESQEPIVTPTTTEQSVPAPEPAPIPTPTPAPVVEQSETVVTTATTTIKTTASSNNRELYKISTQLGINDRFLLANDLFGGDIAALSDALATLDELTNLDDVMIHIAENYKWDGDSEGAKLLFTLLQNRFL